MKVVPVKFNGEDVGVANVHLDGTMDIKVTSDRLRRMISIGLVDSFSIGTHLDPIVKEEIPNFNRSFIERDIRLTQDLYKNVRDTACGG